MRVFSAFASHQPSNMQLQHDRPCWKNCWNSENTLNITASAAASCTAASAMCIALGKLV
jgi:hypothetical protein